MPAHCETVVNGKLVAVRAGQEDIYGNDHPFDIHVQPADFMTRMACIVDGKEPWENPSMTKLYIAMGGIVVLIAAVVIFIINLTRKRFKGVLTIEVTAGADKTYQSKPIDLSVWGKKAVNFGILLSGSGLPPIAELTRADVMNKLSFKPVKEGIRVTNKTDMFGTGAKAVVLAAGKSHRLATADSGFAMKLTYKLNAGDKAEE